MKKLKTRRISYNRLLFILSTVNPNLKPKIDIGFANYSDSEFELTAVIGISVYIVWEPYAGKSPNDIIKSVKHNLQHIQTYSIHALWE